jgi:flagellar hook-basal body complex protein FliE
MEQFESTFENTETDANLKILSEFEDSHKWMLQKLKQNIFTLKEVINYLKRRIQLEEEYGKGMIKLASSMYKVGSQEGKQGTFGDAWETLRHSTTQLGENAIGLKSNIQAINNELLGVSRDTEKSRKQLKEFISNWKKQLDDAENILEKSRVKMEALHDIQKKGGGFSLFQKNPAEIYQKGLLSDQTYRQNTLNLNALRHEYNSFHYPNVLKSLKETNDECDLALQALLLKYVANFESKLLEDVSIFCSPEESTKKKVSNINNKEDFEHFMSQFVYFGQNISLKSEEIKNKIEVKKSLADILSEEKSEIPLKVKRYLDFIDKNGLDVKGLYRSPVRDVSDKEKEIIKSSLKVKQYFSSLPEVLLTDKLNQAFIDSAKTSDPEDRLNAIHHLVNQLPDANYTTLRYLSRCLKNVCSYSAVNGLDVDSMAAEFGNILLNPQSDFGPACTVIETIVNGYNEIFDPIK